MTRTVSSSKTLKRLLVVCRNKVIARFKLPIWCRLVRRIEHLDRETEAIQLYVHVHTYDLFRLEEEFEFLGCFAWRTSRY